jgi:prefoldin subunit 5
MPERIPNSAYESLQRYHTELEARSKELEETLADLEAHSKKTTGRIILPELGGEQERGKNQKPPAKH